MATTTMVRRAFTNLDEPQQIRELNRQMDWLWRQLLGKLDAKAFSTNGLEQIIAATRDVLADEISEEDVGAAAFLKALGDFAIQKVSEKQFSVSDLVHMLSKLFDIKEDDGTAYIINLEVTEGNIENATAKIRADIRRAQQTADDTRQALENLTVNESMIGQDVWDRIQDMIDGNNGG